MVREVLVLACSLVVLGQLLAAQDTKAAVVQVIQQAESAGRIETSLAALFDKPSPDIRQISSQIESVHKSVAAIKASLDQLDARYDTLTEEQRDAVREAWTLAELLGAYVENQVDALPDLSVTDRRQEAKTNAQCAIRRAAMLVESLRQLAKA